jgi:hypothetical protein
MRGNGLSGRWRTSLWCLLGLCVAVWSVEADVPGQIHYQGRLISAGKGVSGDANLTFRLYDDLSAGNLLHEDAQTLGVVDGFYSAYIGASTPVPPEVFRDHDSVFLEIEVDGQIMLPRERIVAVGYALNAQYAQEAQVAHRLINQPVPTVIEEDGGPVVLHIGSTTNIAFLVNMNSITQTITPEVDTKINWEAKEYDTSPAVNLTNDRFVAPVDGYYRFTAQVYLAPAILRTLTKHDQKLAKIQLRHNGSIIASHVIRTSGKGGFSLLASRDRFLSSGEYIEVFVRQNMSADVNMVADGPLSRSYFSGFLIMQQ